MAEQRHPRDVDESARRVGVMAVVLVVGICTAAAVALWVGVSVVRCHYAFEWLVRRRECGVDSVLIPALTIPAIAVGGLIALRRQRWFPVWAGLAVAGLPLAAFPIAPYGFGGGLAESLEGQVEDAMKRLPTYEYTFLPSRSKRGYVIFRVEDRNTGARTRIAYGGAAEGPARDQMEECRRPPDVPVEHPRRSKPFAAAGPEPLICFESYVPRKLSKQDERVLSRGDIAYDVANAICEEVYGPWTCFF